MSALLTIVTFLIVIFVLVLAHELGHFITAKLRHVRVLEFGLGFPPRLFGIKRGETVYSVNIIPLGGFVKMAGEEDPTVAGSLASQSVGTRLLVLSAGAIMNLVLPFLLLSAAFMVPHDVYHGQVVVEQVQPSSPAAEAGILPGDALLKVNGRQIGYSGDLSRAVQLNLGRPITLELRHATGDLEAVKVTPRWKPPAGQGAIGILTSTENLTVSRVSEPFWKAVPDGISDCIDTFLLFKNGIISMVIGATPAQFAGPVGIAQITGQAASAGLSPLLEFAAFLSINLGLFNIFPLPALDGGRIAFVLLEWVRRGKRIAPRTEALVHLAGFVLLILFFVAVTFQDIVRIVTGGSFG